MTESGYTEIWLKEIEEEVEKGYAEGYADAKKKFKSECKTCKFDCRDKQQKIIKEYQRFKRAVEEILK
jgi:flagellar biosynthesis/type III secretory pathway protein FliH